MNTDSGKGLSLDSIKSIGEDDTVPCSVSAEGPGRAT